MLASPRPSWADANRACRLIALHAESNPGRGVVRRVALAALLRPALVAVLAIGAALMQSGCASVPSQEMSDARRALDAALHAGARQLVPSAVERADSTLESASSALRAGQYDEARDLARSSRDEAIAARMLATRLVQIKEAIASARAEGRAWQYTDQLMQRALAMSRAGDTPGALSIADQAVKSLR